MLAGAGLAFGTNVSRMAATASARRPSTSATPRTAHTASCPKTSSCESALPSRAGDFVIDNSNTDPNRSNVRAIETTPGTTGSSGLTYANIFGVLNSTSFERNAAGQLTARGQAPSTLPSASASSSFRRRRTARSSIRFFRTNDRTTSSTRAMVTSQTIRSACGSPSGLSTRRRLSRLEGRKELDPIAATNGRDLDGTPILTSPSQIDGLASKGLIELRTRPVDDGVFRWVICPIPEDPRDGFIRPDAFIRDVKRATARPSFPHSATTSAACSSQATGATNRDTRSHKRHKAQTLCS
jgi:hypothetical protein